MTATRRVRYAPCFECGGGPIRDQRRRLCHRCCMRLRYAGLMPEVSWDLLLERLVVVTESGCWEWLGSISTGGYGRYRDEYLHRVTYTLFVGSIPSGLHIDHLCRNPACCNPQHLEPVTHRENVNRGSILITHCPQNHPYDEANTAWYVAPNGWRSRQCRTCHRDSEARRRAARAIA